MKAGIAGAGLLGRLLAFRLLQAGWSVSLFDDNATADANNCSMAAAGLLAPVTELDKNDLLIFKLGLASLQYWPGLLHKIDQSIYFQTAGSLVLAHPRDNAELNRFIQIIQSKLSASENIPYQSLTRADITAMEPDLIKWDKGYFFPDEGSLDNQAMLHELANFLCAQGVKWHNHAFVEHTKPSEIVVNGSSHTFDWVFDCRGLGGVSHFPQLRGVRGELVWLHAPSVHIHRSIRLLGPRHNVYIVPRPNHIYVVGASEIESEDDSPISARTLFELIASACYVHSGFEEARVIKTLTQVRPTLPDNLPTIKYTDKLIAVNGLYRHGFLIAPAIVEEIFSYIQGGKKACKYGQLWQEFSPLHKTLSYDRYSSP